MGIDRILGRLIGAGGAGERKPSLPKATTPTFVPPPNTDAATKRGDQQLYGDYRRSLVEAVWARQTQQAEQTESVQRTASAQQQGEYREVTTDQMRRIMGESRWEVQRPRITAKMSPRRRAAVMQIRARRQAERDARLEYYTRRMSETMREYSINTPAKQAAFLATVGIESAGMTQMEELPSRHASSRSLYRGRGIIQLTHRDNYERASRELNLGEPPDYDLLVRQPELAASPEYAFQTAGWFWSAREHPFDIPNNVVGEQPRADLRDFREASSLVNSGRPDGPINGWADRLVYYERALDALEIEVDQQTRDNIQAGQQGPRNLPPEPSYIQWQNEQRARRRANRND